MQFPRPEVRIDPRTQTKKTRKHQNKTRKGPEPNATITTLPPKAVLEELLPITASKT